MKLVQLGAAFAVISLLSGCATIINDETQRVNVRTSNNVPVDITLDGQEITTPGSVLVKRGKADLAVYTSDEKCASSTFVESDVDNVFFINVLSGGVFGSSTDYATEQMWEYESDVVINCNN